MRFLIRVLATVRLKRMSSVQFDADWQYNGCRVLRLESDLLRLDILPEAGGRIYHWIDKPLDRDWLWQHPRIKPSILPESTNYDDTFSGGWDELFPNGSLGQHAGEFYPDHGEYWTKRFDWDVQQSLRSVTLHLLAEGSVTPTRMERWITMEAGSRAVQIRYKLSHLGEHPVDYLWSLHPALNVNANCELRVPGSKAINAAPGIGRLAAEPLEFNWPLGPGRDGGWVDLSRIPASSGVPLYDMAYVTELNDGWSGVIDHSQRAGFAIAFDRSLFRCAWVFQTHGGWRGLHTAIIEPCTGYPGDLAEAVAHRHCARLEPGQVLETQVTGVVFANRDSVEHVGLDGNVS